MQYPKIQNHEYIKNIQPESHFRMFAGEDFSYIFADIVMRHYQKLGVVILKSKNSWILLMPEFIRQDLLKEGNALYTSKQKYEKYLDLFENYILESRNYFQDVLTKPSLSSTDISKIIDILALHFEYYSKTEFFYTDNIDFKKMAISVQDFESLKTKGRKHYNYLFFEENGVIKSLIKKISDQFNHEYQSLFAYSIPEIISIFNETVHPDILEERNVFAVSKDLKLYGSQYHDFVDQKINQYSQHYSKNVISGKSAYLGKVTGRARLIINTNFKKFDQIKLQIDQMEIGEILVTESTSPELISACKKAAGIITNQGGILSHAAIISREMKIPCIIGTNSDVTKIIKTGDLIELDANNGTITIL